MSLCPTCQQPRPLKRGGLEIRTAAPSITWQGVPVDLRPAERKILALLLERGFASWGALEMIAVGPNSSLPALRVHISNLRRKLKEQGVEVSIVTERGMGLRLG